MSIKWSGYNKVGAFEPSVSILKPKERLRLETKQNSWPARQKNNKLIDKVSSLDLWYHFMKAKPYPSWIWSKCEPDKGPLVDSDYKLLLRQFKIKDIDLDYLIEHHFDFIKNELNYFKKLQKQ